MEWEPIETLQSRLRIFAAERDWDQFHAPKNLAMALAVEASELMEHFQWLSGEQSQSLSGEKLEQVADEIADVQIYLARLADKLDVNIAESVERKMRINAHKYPAHRVRGSARKYDEYEGE